MAVHAGNSIDPVRAMTEGGDERILLDEASGLNRYHSAPRPRPDMLAFASSTANDISPDAFEWVRKRLADLGPVLSETGYAEALEQLRGRIRRAYDLPADVDIVFAPSGTDLEYVALACVAGKSVAGTRNILLGADEVGSGCIYSARGCYFAERTAIALPVRAGDPVPGLGDVALDLIDIPVRDAAGHVRHSAEIADRMRQSATAASAAGDHTLVHVVHGSKTGLILPTLDDVAGLGRLPATTLVVDACQARITSEALRDYLGRGAIVFVTGSKFMGGPPFSGFALVPASLSAGAPPLPDGFATIFRRAEWPASWPGRERLPNTVNLGLLMRLEAAIFELERFQSLSQAQATRVILSFHAAVRSEIIEQSRARRVAPYPPGDRVEADTHPIEMRTLSTLDLSALAGGGATFEQAQSWNKGLIERGIRLGQPVKCVRLADGGWGATLRVGLAMWQVVERASLSDDALASTFADDMKRVREGLAEVTG